MMPDGWDWKQDTMFGLLVTDKRMWFWSVILVIEFLIIWSMLR